MARVIDFKNRDGNWVKYYSDRERSNSITRMGSVHKDMLARCTPGSYVQAKNPLYEGCTVSPLFENYQTFCDWYSQQIGYEHPGWQLDKDILKRGNKLYSEDTCIIVPNCLNKFLTKTEAKRGKYPIGVAWVKRNRRFRAAMTLRGETNYLGLFDTPEEAFIAYKIAKEAEAKRLADFWEGQIDPRGCEALRAYNVEITD